MDSSRYLALGGSRRAYYDLVKRAVMSRRQYLKRRGVFPAGGARRPARGASRAARYPATERPQPYTKTIPLPLGIAAEIHPRTAYWYDVVIHHVWVVPLNLEQRGKRHRWHCGMGGCPHHYDNLYKMALHCYEAHYQDACQRAGVGPCAILPVHEIHTLERRSRMPWRVSSAEHEDLPVTRYCDSVSQ